MPTLTADITYLFHSGYRVETANYLLIFDYYWPGGSKTAGALDSHQFPTDKDILVFVSHSHGDHCDPAIWEWGHNHSRLTYIVSSDVVPRTTSPCRQLAPYEETMLGEVAVKAFGSTDLGVSFHVKADGLSIFHAGDLNWWHWSGETLPERQQAEKMFKHEMAVLEQNLTDQLDIAFFPVDRRLEEAYCLGAEYFGQALRPKLLLPMHFGDDFGASTAFAARAAALAITTLPISSRGQRLQYSRQ